ncbi:MAG: hypothetical protein IKP95_09525 [Ruminococcus sp.]|nr:hypothetical protein [Ruminococcus sp.]
MANSDLKKLDEGQLDLMWSFLRAGMVKPNVEALKEMCDQLRQAMIQKTAGQRTDDPSRYISFEDLGTIINSIVIETMALFLSGDLDLICKHRKDENNGQNQN